MVLSQKSGFGSFGEGFLFVSAAGGLEASEFGGFAFAAAGKAVFLKLEVAEFFFMQAADAQFNCSLVLAEGGAGMFFDDF